MPCIDCKLQADTSETINICSRDIKQTNKEKNVSTTTHRKEKIRKFDPSIKILFKSNWGPLIKNPTPEPNGTPVHGCVQHKDNPVLAVNCIKQSPPFKGQYFIKQPPAFKELYPLTGSDCVINRHMDRQTDRLRNNREVIICDSLHMQATLKVKC